MLFPRKDSCPKIDAEGLCFLAGIIANVAAYSIAGIIPKSLLFGAGLGLFAACGIQAGLAWITDQEKEKKAIAAIVYFMMVVLSFSLAHDSLLYAMHAGK